MNKNETEEEKRPLKKWETKAIELRYEGYSYADMSKMLKQSLEFDISWSMLGNLFAEDGRLKQDYLDYCEKMNEEAMAEGKRAIKSSHALASKTLVSLMAKRYPASIRLASAKEIIDRNIGRVRQNLGLDGGEDGKAIQAKLEVIFKDFSDDEDTTT
jgi:hypothetical protein